MESNQLNSPKVLKVSCLRPCCGHPLHKLCRWRRDNHCIKRTIKKQRPHEGAAESKGMPLN